MRFLITGIQGQLGYDVARVLREKYGEDVDIVAPTLEEMDITDSNKVFDVITEVNPDVIFHCAAYTAVDKAEDEVEKCWKINYDGTKNIIDAAFVCDAKVMFISTDYVFDGTKDIPYMEDDKTNPLNEYGKSKVKAEEYVRSYPKGFVARTSWVFGKNGNNFIKTMLKLAKEKDELGVVCDQVGSPTYSLDLARKIVEIAETEKYDTYHINNEGYTSWYDFAKKIFEIKCIPMKVNAVKTEDYKTRAVRPLNSRLYRNKLAANGFASLPTWEDALKRYLVEISYTQDETGKYIFENGSTATPTEAEDAYIIEPRVFGDNRGYFSPFFVCEYMEALGFSKTAQTNKSKSGKNVLRGLHFQEYPHDQAKIVEVINGRAIDVIVDIREGSPTYGKSVSLELMPYDPEIEGSGRQLYVPRGFAHGFISLEDNTIFQYLIDNTYAPKFEGGILWNDEVVKDTWNNIFEKYNINPEDLQLSDKDKVRPALAESPTYFTYTRRIK